MNSVEFEQLLSFRPGGQPVCVRDAIFDYYCGTMHDTDRAHEATKKFTDYLFGRFVQPADSLVPVPVTPSAPRCERCRGDRFISVHENLPDEPCPVCNSGAPSGTERVRLMARVV